MRLGCSSRAASWARRYSFAKTGDERFGLRGFGEPGTAAAARRSASRQSARIACIGRSVSSIGRRALDEPASTWSLIVSVSLRWRRCRRARAARSPRSARRVDQPWIARFEQRFFSSIVARTSRSRSSFSDVSRSACPVSPFEASLEAASDGAEESPQTGLSDCALHRSPAR